MAPAQGSDSEEAVQEKPRKDPVYQRVVYGALIFSAFLFIIAAGHTYCAIFVLVMMIMAYYELVELLDKTRTSRDLMSDGEQSTGTTSTGKKKKKRNYLLSKTLDVLSFVSLPTYMLLITLSGFSFPWLFIRLIRLNIPGKGYYLKILRYHYLLTFIFTLFGLIKFILTLESGKFRAQFAQFAIIIVSLIYVVILPMLIISNIYYGMIWFVMTHFMVVVNDILAWAFGKAIGKHPLISISPHKTVEGFVGAAISTVVLSCILAPVLVKYKPFICQVTMLEIIPFSWLKLDCQPHSVFLDKTFELPQALASILNITQITYKPFTVHVVILATFASIFAPLGGLLASGFKRALKIKDFSNTIPGHGGIMDRFDCQTIMGTFTYLYLKTFVKSGRYTAEAAIKVILKMNPEEQRKVFENMSQLFTE